MEKAGGLYARDGAGFVALARVAADPDGADHRSFHVPDQDAAGRQS
jgi:hypothetical protein